MDCTTATAANLRAGFFLRLPFRIRLGDLHRFTQQSPASSDIWIYNPVPLKGDPNHFATLVDAPFDQLCTELFVIVNRPEVSEADLNTLRGNEEFVPDLDDSSRIAQQAVNRFILSYNHATSEGYGGRKLYTLSDTDFNRCCHWALIVICPSDYRLTQREVASLVTRRPKSTDEFEIINVAEYLSDFSDETAAYIQESQDHLERNIFYDYAFNAHDHESHGRFDLAILSASVALEGVNRAIIRSRRAAKTGTSLKRIHASQRKTLKCIGLRRVFCDSYFLIDEELRPPIELLQ